MRLSRTVQLIDDQNTDLYKLFKDNIVGGPSWIFHRYHEKNVTRISEREFGAEAKLCKQIVEMDANALYLYCVMSDMPVGKPIRRWKEKDFVPECRKMSYTANGWLLWVEFHTGKRLET